MVKLRDVLSASLLLFALSIVIMAISSLHGCTTPQPGPTASPNPTPSPSQVGDSSGGTVNVSQAEAACRGYYWKDRGRAPRGFMDGVVATLRRSVCLKRTIVSQAWSSPDKDALAWYSIQPSYANVYTLLLGLGMRESSGNYGEGFDTSAGPETASEAEAGAFQFSYNSIGASPSLGAIYKYYQDSPSGCLLPVFSQGARGSYQDTRGSGSGAEFQAFTKKCPAFQAEYAATLVRVLRKHFGPLNRKEAEFNPSCAAWLTQVERETACE